MLRSALGIVGSGLQCSFLPFSRKNDDTTSSAQENLFQLDEDGCKRVLAIFQRDETGSVNPELVRINQLAIASLFVGQIYGSFSKMKENVAKGLVGGAAKNAVLCGGGAVILTTTYMGIVTLISTYRDTLPTFEYVLAGSITGAMYYFNKGVKAIRKGVLTGAILGTFAGGATIVITNMTGLSRTHAKTEYKRVIATKAEHKPTELTQEQINEKPLDISTVNMKEQHDSWDAIAEIEHKIKLKLEKAANDE